MMKVKMLKRRKKVGKEKVEKEIIIIKRKKTQ